MSDRFRFAMAKTEPQHWQAFERLASAFLADEHATLRTLAAPSGDEGQDATLFRPEDDPSIAIQYSVQRDWNDKLRKTARRLRDRHAQVKQLVYATPLRIGADGDSARARLWRDFGLAVDIRDEHYFAEREERSPSTREAAERYCRLVVDPLLEDAGLLDRTGARLTSHEARAVLLYLVLEHQDAERDRQLTKLCFDALALAVLRHTDNESRLARSEIRRRVTELLPAHETSEVIERVDRALEHLTKSAIRHWAKPDEFVSRVISVFAFRRGSRAWPH